MIELTGPALVKTLCSSKSLLIYTD